MITPDYCRVMSRYNAWQNNSLRDHVEAMDEEDVRRNRGAFFGSMFSTLNHLLWGDCLWLNRLDPTISAPDPEVTHLDITDSPAAWSAERLRVDGVMGAWARGLTSRDLTGDVVWFSTFYQTEFHHPKTLCVTHMFNHQTHHRGQVHAMLTAAGRKTLDTDLIFMPES